MFLEKKNYIIDSLPKPINLDKQIHYPQRALNGFGFLSNDYKICPALLFLDFFKIF